MADVDWDDVPKPEQVEAPKKGGILGTVAFIVLLLLGTVAGGAYVNSVMLGERVRDLVVKECPDSTCPVDVRAKHAECFAANVTYGMPASIADFQTPATSPTFGIGTVSLEAYRTCVRPPKAKTLADESP